MDGIKVTRVKIMINGTNANHIKTRIRNLHPKNINADRLGNFYPSGVKKTTSQGGKGNTDGHLKRKERKTKEKRGRSKGLGKKKGRKVNKSNVKQGGR